MRVQRIGKLRSGAKLHVFPAHFIEPDSLLGNPTFIRLIELFAVPKLLSLNHAD